VDNFLDGLRYVAREPVVRGCIVIAIVQNLFSLTYTQLMPLFAAEIFAVGGAGMGALLSAAGIGSLVGALGSAVLSVSQRKGWVVFGTGVALGGLLAAFGQTTAFPLALVLLVAIGCTQALTMITNQMVLNLATPDELRGRAMAVYMMTWSISPLAALPAGWAADQFGVAATETACGLLLVAGILLASALLRPVREFEDTQYEQGKRIGQTLYSR
jgi:MFS family permease